MKFSKRILTIFLASLCTVYSVHAQDKKASLGLGFGGAAASSKGDDGVKSSGFGLNFFINGMYNINENLSAGLEYNGNAVVLGDLAGASISASTINGILAKGRYLIGTGKSRPFVGLMLGIYNIQPGEVSGTTSLAIIFEKKTVFGFAPEVGVSLGSFQIATSYHLPGKYKSQIDLPVIGVVTFEETFSVWQFNIGWNIGLMDN